MATATKAAPKGAAKHEEKRVHPLKTMTRNELERRFKGLDGGVFVGYRGINSEKIYDLRAKLRDKKVKFTVVKNSICIRAFSDMGYDRAKLEKIFDGPIGIVHSVEGGTGAVGAIKALRDWKKATKDKTIETKGGFLDGAIIDAKGVQALADLPSREQLLGMVAGAFQAPIGAFANRLYGAVAKFAYAVDAVREKKEKEGGAAAAPAK